MEENLLVVADYELSSDWGYGHARPDLDGVDLGGQLRVNDHPLKFAFDGKFDRLISAECEARNFLKKCQLQNFFFVKSSEQKKLQHDINKYKWILCFWRPRGDAWVFSKTYNLR